MSMNYTSNDARIARLLVERVLIRRRRTHLFCHVIAAHERGRHGKSIMQQELDALARRGLVECERCHSIANSSPCNACRGYGHVE